MNLLKELLSITEAKAEVIRGHDGKALRGMRKELAVRAREHRWKLNPEQAARDKAEEYRYGKAKVRRVAEEAIEVRPAADVWKDSKDDSKTYISNAEYFVKKIQGGAKFEVTTVENNERKPFATLTKLALDSSFTPMRPNQIPDAEGFVQYRDVDEIEAFKYDGDTINVDLDGETVKLGKGDYLLRSSDDTDFKYEVKTAQDFDEVYSEK